MLRTFLPAEQPVQPDDAAPPAMAPDSASIATGVNGLPVLAVVVGGGGGAPGTDGDCDTPPDGLGDGLTDGDLDGCAEPLGLPGLDESGWAWPLSSDTVPLPLPPPSGICPAASCGSSCETPTTMRTTTTLAATRRAGSATPPPLRVIQKRRRRPR